MYTASQTIAAYYFQHLIYVPFKSKIFGQINFAAINQSSWRSCFFCKFSGGILISFPKYIFRSYNNSIKRCSLQIDRSILKLIRINNPWRKRHTIDTNGSN